MKSMSNNVMLAMLPTRASNSITASGKPKSILLLNITPPCSATMADVAIGDHADDFSTILDDRQHSAIVFTHQFRCVSQTLRQPNSFHIRRHYFFHFHDCFSIHTLRLRMSNERAVANPGAGGSLGFADPEVQIWVCIRSKPKGHDDGWRSARRGTEARVVFHDTAARTAVRKSSHEQRPLSPNPSRIVNKSADLK